MEKFLLIIGLLNLLILLYIGIITSSLLKVYRVIKILLLLMIVIFNMLSWMLFFIATELLIIMLVIFFSTYLIGIFSMEKNTLESKYERDRNDFN